MDLPAPEWPPMSNTPHGGGGGAGASASGAGRGQAALDAAAPTGSVRMVSLLGEGQPTDGLTTAGVQGTEDDGALAPRGPDRAAPIVKDRRGTAERATELRACSWLPSRHHRVASDAEECRGRAGTTQHAPQPWHASPMISAVAQDRGGDAVVFGPGEGPVDQPLAWCLVRAAAARGGAPGRRGRGGPALAAPRPGPDPPGAGRPGARVGGHDEHVPPRPTGRLRVLHLGL